MASGLGFITLTCAEPTRWSRQAEEWTARQHPDNPLKLQLVRPRGSVKPPISANDRVAASSAFTQSGPSDGEPLRDIVHKGFGLVRGTSKTIGKPVAAQTATIVVAGVVSPPMTDLDSGTWDVFALGW